MSETILTQIIDIAGDTLFLVIAYATGFGLAVMIATKAYHLIYQSLED